MLIELGLTLILPTVATVAFFARYGRTLGTRY